MLITEKENNYVILLSPLVGAWEQYKEARIVGGNGRAVSSSGRGAHAPS